MDRADRRRDGDATSKSSDNLDDELASSIESTLKTASPWRRCDSPISLSVTIGRGRWSPRREVHLTLSLFPAMTCAATSRLSPPRRHRLRLQRGPGHARWPNRYQRGSCAVVRPSYGHRCCQSNSARAASFCKFIKGWRYGSGYAADA